MCQIINIKEKKRNQLVSFLLNKKEILKRSLDLKGGEGYSFFLIKKNNKDLMGFETGLGYPIEESITETLDFDEGLSIVLKELINESDIDHELVLFSRQKPEMEKEAVSLPPYFDDKNEIAIWMHGTISNADELSEKYDLDIDVDSEILLYCDPKEIEGNYSSMIYQNGYVSYKDKGLGIYKYFYENISVITTDINFDKIEGSHRKKENLIVSYSGGMDITLSLIKQLNKIYYENIYLCYFDYGARASIEEINTLNKMKDYLKDNYKSNIEIKIFDVKGLIKNISDIYQQNIKLIDSESKADEKEAESTLAYIPFRNTIFMELLGTFAEGKNLDIVDFLFGLNLSEGMIYLDNSEIWLDHINKLIKRAGKKYYPNWKIEAPFYNRTKTNMIKDSIKELGKDKVNELLNISFSCYYPQDGEPCGSCGSCLLRNKALEIASK